MTDDDSDKPVFFFERQARLKAEHLCIPVAAPLDIGHRQPHVMQCNERQDADGRVLHGRGSGLHRVTAGVLRQPPISAHAEQLT